MVYREIVTEAKRLPLSQQFQLVEELLRAMRRTTPSHVSVKPKGVIPFGQLRGALKTEGALPADSELKDAYTEYLREKYL